MLYLVIGATASGKSAYAERLAVQLEQGEKTYIATMLPFDSECCKKIEKHKEMRKQKNFSTVENPMNIHNTTVGETKTAMLECMSNLLANEMFMNDHMDGSVVEHIIKGIQILYSKLDNLVIVSNDIFHLYGGYTPETQLYIQFFSQINQILAEMADGVIEVVCSIPICHKGEGMR